MTFILVGAVIFGGLLYLSRLTRNSGIMLSAGVLAGVWMLWSGFIVATDNYEPWQWGIFLDGVAAFILTLPGASRQRALIAALYWVQISIHVSYGWVTLNSPYPPYEIYTWAIDGLAVLQILFVGGQAIRELLHNRGHHFAPDVTPDLARMDARREK